MIKFKRIKQELVYDSKVVALYKDYLETPDGDRVEYDYVKHKAGGGAGILLVDENDYIYLVRQYRNTIDDVNLEIPAGVYSNHTETGIECAIREGEEETGYVPEEICHISKVMSSIGAYDESTDIYIGRKLKKGHTHYDSLEFIEIVRLPIDEAVKKIYNGEIIDSKTIIAILAYAGMIKNADSSVCIFRQI
jgi:ADP-ribose pyrophosphatase